MSQILSIFFFLVLAFCHTGTVLVHGQFIDSMEANAIEQIRDMFRAFWGSPATMTSFLQPYDFQLNNGVPANAANEARAVNPNGSLLVETINATDCTLILDLTRFQESPHIEILVKGSTLTVKMSYQISSQEARSGFRFQSFGGGAEQRMYQIPEVCKPDHDAAIADYDKKSKRLIVSLPMMKVSGPEAQQTSEESRIITSSTIAPAHHNTAKSPHTHQTTTIEVVEDPLPFQISEIKE